MPPPLEKSEGGVCTQAKNRLDAKRCCDSEYYLGYEYNEVSLNILQIFNGNWIVFIIECYLSRTLCSAVYRYLNLKGKDKRKKKKNSAPILID